MEGSCQPWWPGAFSELPGPPPPCPGALPELPGALPWPLPLPGPSGLAPSVVAVPLGLGLGEGEGLAGGEGLDGAAAAAGEGDAPAAGAAPPEHLQVARESARALATAGWMDRNKAQAVKLGKSACSRVARRPGRWLEHSSHMQPAVGRALGLAARAQHAAPHGAGETNCRQLE